MSLKYNTRFAWKLAAVTVLLALVAIPAAAVPSRSKQQLARNQFVSAEKMREALNGTPSSERSKREYQRVSDAYRRVYYMSPASSKADSSVVAVAELLAEMGRAFNDRNSLRSAIGQYEFLRREYPGSKYRFDALFTIGQIYKDDLEENDKAKETFQEFLRRYPRHRLASDARDAIAEMEAPKTRKEAKEKQAVAEKKSTLPLVTGIRSWSTPDYTRVAIDLEGEVKYEAGRVPDPDRIFFDLHDTRLASVLVGKTFDVSDGFLRKIRVAQFQKGLTRIVLDVDDVSDYSAFLLPNPYRLIIDIHGRKPQKMVAKTAAKSDLSEKASKEVAKADAKEDAKVEAKREPREDSKLEARNNPPEVSADVKPEIKPAATDSKPAAKSETRKKAPILWEDSAPSKSASKSESKKAEAAKSASPDRETDDEKTGDRKTDGRKSPESKRTVAGKNENPEKPVTKAERAAIAKQEAKEAKEQEEQEDGASTKTEVAKLSSTELKATPKPTSEPTFETVAPRGPERAGKKSSSKKTAEADVRQARPTSSGERSLIRALGLKIGRIVVDAGHGGHDTGTIGPSGLLEKDLVLDVALRLGKLLEGKMGADVIYTRDDDTFIPLETRTAVANQNQADLFISIHANSSQDTTARGIETYYLNFTSSPDALEVAARENAVSEKSIHELQDLVKKIALKEKIDESREFAADVQHSLYSGLAVKSPTLRDRGVKKAPFIVLIGANMPSILAEISFVSNPQDERRLQTPEYRQKIAESLYKGVARYVSGLSGVKVAAKAKEDLGQ